MKKSILLIDTQGKNLVYLAPLLGELESRDCVFSLLSDCAPKSGLTNVKVWRKFKWLCSLDLNKVWQMFLFLFFSPAILFGASLFLFYLKYFKKIKTIVCGHYPEKLALTKIGRLLRFRIIWLEFPGRENRKQKSLLKTLLRRHARFSRTVVFSQLAKQKLIQEKYSPENITVILPGIKQKALIRQNNIFSELALIESRLAQKKFFTLGVIVPLEFKKLGDKMEKLFQAVKKALTVVPSLQLIIVGEGTERKNLGWLAKKMEIDNLVWFVGGPATADLGNEKHLKKWLDSFDAYVAVSDELDLSDRQILLQALYAKLPVIAPSYVGLDEIILENETGILVNTDDSEALTQKIIALQQNKVFRKNLGEKARKSVEQNFTIEKMADEFEKIL